MAEERTPRSADDREADTRPTDAWVPAKKLPTPEPKDGWVYRWIRTSTLNKADNSNISQKFREGWVPVKKDDHPDQKGSVLGLFEQIP